MNMNEVELARLTERIRDGDFPRPELASEADYHARWLDATVDAGSPVELAALGGAIADRLAWVFVAGYQAGIRHTFPELAADGWLAFAVSEDRNPQSGRPGVQLSADGQVLSGFKTWVAAVDHVERLVVKAGRGSGASYFALPRSAPGLQLSNPKPGAFLTELSQGVAELDDVPVSAAVRLDPGRVAHFGLREALYIFLAFSAFALRRSIDSAVQQRSSAALEALAAAVGRDPLQAGWAAGLRAVDEMVQALADLGDAGRIPCAGQWSADSRLIRMYSKGLQTAG